MTGRRFPPPWRVEYHPGGESLIVRDANGQALAYGGGSNEVGPSDRVAG